MSLTIKENNNALIQGVVRTGAGQIQNIAGWTFQFRVVQGSTMLFEKTSGSGITITDAVNGKIDVAILPADTDAKAGTYQYELKGTDTMSNIFTLNGPAELIITPTII